MARIVIIGAGLTGLSTAYHLEQAGYTDFEIFEQEQTVGGLCRSITHNGFTFDYTGHLLHANDPYVSDLIGQLIGLEQFHQIVRRSFIFSHGVYTPYPFQMHLRGLPAHAIAECVEGFVRRPKRRVAPRLFPDWVRAQFGQGFGKYFFFPYQRKIFAYNINKITSSWTGRFVPATTLEHIVNGIAFDKSTEGIGYNSQFLYPKQGGIAVLPNSLAAHIKKPIRTQYRVQTIDMRTRTVHFDNGHVEPFSILINTMPLDRFLTSLRERSSTLFARAPRYLRCNSVINFNLGIQRDNVSDKHWVYFPERTFPFYRLGFPHNISPGTVPTGHSSIYGEFAHVGKSKPWQQRTLETALAATKTLLQINEHDITMQKIITIDHAYVIFDTWRDRYLPQLLGALNEEKIYSIGRYGGWKYASMQEAILDGKQMAQQLLTSLL